MLHDQPPIIEPDPEVLKPIKLNLKEQNTSNYSIFSYLDFENLWASSGFSIDESPTEGGTLKILNGPIGLSIPVNNITGLNEAVKQKVINEDESENPLKKVKIIIAVNNDSNDNLEKYSIYERSLRDILFENDNVIRISDINILGEFSNNQDPIFNVNIYAQGTDSYELLDMFSFEIDYIQELLIFDLMKIRDNRLDILGDLRSAYELNQVALLTNINQNDVPDAVNVANLAAATSYGVGNLSLFNNNDVLNNPLGGRVLDLQNQNLSAPIGNSNPLPFIF